jgi:hypothetical protein
MTLLAIIAGYILLVFALAKVADHCCQTTPML